MTTVWIYIDPNTMLATPIISRCLPIRSPRTNGSRRTIPKARHSSMRSWSEAPAAVVTVSLMPARRAVALTAQQHAKRPRRERLPGNAVD